MRGARASGKCSREWEVGRYRYLYATGHVWRCGTDGGRRFVIIFVDNAIVCIAAIVVYAVQGAGRKNRFVSADTVNSGCGCGFLFYVAMTWL